MALVARALLPSDDTIAGWASLAPAQAWAAIPADVWGALATALGDAQLDNPALFAALPPEQVRVSIGTAGLSPIMGTKVKLMYAALRIKYGMEPLECYGGPGNAAAGASVAAGSGSPASGTQGAVMKVRIATVLDQASDREIELLDGTTLAALRRTYKVNQGGPPTEVEEVTDAQLSALARVVRAGGCPYADFGVWGPYGNRIAKQLRFTHHFIDGAGQWRSKELHGPDSVEAWERSWRVFRSAAIMAGIATAAVLDTYATRFKQRVSKYPWAWNICCLADQRFRSEWWMHEQRRQVDFHAANPNLSAYSDQMPWNSVIKASAGASEFWKEELEDPAMLARVETPRGQERRGVHGGSASSPRRRSRSRPAAYGKGRAKPKNKGTGLADKRVADGRFRMKDGQEICYAWNRAGDGCEAQCPHKRAHVCEWCLQSHRAIQCPKHPGWKPVAGKAPAARAQS